MRRLNNTNASVAWLPPPAGHGGLAGAAFLVGEDVALTCAHTVRDHLGLGEVIPAEPPDGEIVLQFVALGQAVSARVANCGWLPDRDIAVLTLAEPLLDVTCAAPANTPPSNGVLCYAYGCPGETVDLYGEHGQLVYLEFRPQLDACGLHQLQRQPSGESGFTVKRGFSGAPVFDLLGNIVLGMVVGVDELHRVALAVPASDLSEALRDVRRCARQAGRAEPHIAVHAPGPLDHLAANTLRSARDRMGQRPPEASGIVPPVAALQGALRQAAEEAARQPDLIEAVRRALENFRGGNSQQLEALLREHADRLMDAAGETKAVEPRTPSGADTRQLAAEAFRQLGAVATSRNIADALAAYRRAAELDPDDTWTWIHISRLEHAAGRLAAAEAAVCRANQLAENMGVVWDAAAAKRQHGVLLLAKGQLAAAEQAFDASRRTAERLMAGRSDDAQRQHDLSVSWRSIGDVRVAQGDLGGALDAYSAALAIGESIAAADPDHTEWQRDLSVSWRNIGDVRVAQGDLAGALDAYTVVKAVLDKVAAADPSNAEWQRDLSVSWNRIGDVRVAQGDLAGALDAYTADMAIAERLAAADPGNAKWQRDLSVSWNKLGDVRIAQGDLGGALDAYTAAMAIRDNLAAADPGNAGWQRDLSVSWDNIGDVRTAQGDLGGALDAYTAGKAIRDKLAAADPGNAEWQRDLIVSHVKLSEVAAEPDKVRAHLAAALEIARALEQSGRLAPVDAFIPGMLEQRLAALDE